jgi:hypothetical protein
MSWYRLNINTEKQLQRFSVVLIVASTILITCEIIFGTAQNQKFFDIVDILLVLLFTYEIMLRHKSHRTDIFERVWYYFDICLLILGYLSFLKGFFTHPETIYVLRLFRVTRILRLFEISNKLKSIEKKIIHVIPSVITFGALLLLLIFVYALLGMSLFEKRNFEIVSFSNLYSSSKALFIFITSGLDYAEVIRIVEKDTPNLPIFVVDFYFFSFFIVTSMITLNVFIAVMTNSVQEELIQDIKNIDRSNDHQIKEMNQKIDLILDELKKQKL